MLCCYLTRAAAVLIAYPGATIIGNDIDCGQQQSPASSGSSGCRVCCRDLAAVEAECRGLPSCAAFVFDDASGCAELKSAAHPRFLSCSGRGSRRCRLLSLQDHTSDGATTYVLLSLKSGRQQQQQQQQGMPGDAAAGTDVAVAAADAGGRPADAATAAISAAAAFGR
ncbi:hypothetical protein OEZ86_007028 [Tetradesmus obliquus]|nr:hypothetical protein OEZ86_007028 [Tetradesmus obliquus]